MEPFKVRAAVNWERQVAIVGGLAWPFLSLIVYFLTRSDMLAAVPLCLFFPFLFTSPKARLLRKRSYGMSEEGISALEDDRVLWSLPWSRYGNFRRIKLSVLTSLLNPDRMGIELLDKSGVVVGMLNLEPGGPNRSAADDYEQQFLKRKFFCELEHRALDSEERAKAVRQYSTTPRRVRAQFFLSIVCVSIGLVLLFGLGEIIRNGFTGESWQVLAVSGWTLLLCLVSMFARLAFLPRSKLRSLLAQEQRSATSLHGRVARAGRSSFPKSESCRDRAGQALSILQ